MHKFYADKSLQEMVEMLKRNYLRQSGWMDSAETKMSVDRRGPVPWYTYPALAQLKRIIKPKWRVFEFGAGNSSLWWAEQCKEVVSVEDDKAYFEMVLKNAPKNGTIVHRPIDAPLETEHAELISKRLGEYNDHFPEIPDEKRIARGLENERFSAYAAEVLRHKQGYFDVIVVDGMARHLCAATAIEALAKDGIIIFDNSDRKEYNQAYELLRQSGFARIDFWGLGPINPYQSCTSFFTRNLATISANGAGQSLPAKPAQPNPEPASIATPPKKKEPRGIMVLGYMRPLHLQAILESLRLQEVIDITHVWLDGHGNRKELRGDHAVSCKNIAQNYDVKQLCAMTGHLGIEKMMLDGLEHMAKLYDSVLVIEDDCFPVNGAVEQIFSLIEEKASDKTNFSVYGHHFEVPGEGENFTRFQGWGWGSTSEKLEVQLPKLRRLFNLPEKQYLSQINKHITDDLRKKLDVTSHRNVLNTLLRVFSWDSALTFLTAKQGLTHTPTPEKTVYNFGTSSKDGHFKDTPFVRKPPFNMISLKEVWDTFQKFTPPAGDNGTYFGLDELDRLIHEALGFIPEHVIELGAYDGITQNNSIFFEKEGAKCLLIEPCYEAYSKTVNNRPNATVVNAACVSADCTDDYIEITDVGLMSLVSNDENWEAEWLERGESFHHHKRQTIWVPTRTLSSILDETGFGPVELMILDVEGNEKQVMQGLDLTRHKPTYICAEDSYNDIVYDYLLENGYELKQVLLERKFTRDRLYVAKDA